MGVNAVSLEQWTARAEERSKVLLSWSHSTLEATQGQIDGFLSQLPFRYCLSEVASVGDWLKICSWAESRVVQGLKDSYPKVKARIWP